MSINRLADRDYEVSNDDTDYYGKQYWFAHQTTDLVLPDIEERADSDLSGRCLWWLKTIMKYRLPGGTALDVGCSHGAMVFLLGQAGYAASGLELSRYIVDMAKEKFNVPVHCGPVETLPAKPASIDLVCLFDVLEHLADPVATLASCVELMSADGVFVIQCPKYDPAFTHEQLVEAGSPFLKMLIPEEHLFLFSLESAKLLFASLGFKHFREEPAYYSEHDMFFVASRKELASYSAEKIQSSLMKLGNANKIQLLLRLFDSNRATEATLQTVELDRAARLQSIDALMLGQTELEAAAKERLALVDQLSAQILALEADLKLVNADRAQILADTKKLTSQAETLQKEVETSAADRKQMLTDIEQVTAEQSKLLSTIEEIEGDRSKRSVLIQELTAQVNAGKQEANTLAADRKQLLLDTQQLTSENGKLLSQIDLIEADRAERVSMIETLTIRVEALQVEVDALSADRKQLLLDATKLSSELAELKVVSERTGADAEQRLQDVDKLTSLNAELSKELEVVNKDREERSALVIRLSSQLENLQQAADEIGSDREQVLRDNQTLATQIAALQKNLDEVNEDRSERLKVIESLAAEVQSKARSLDELSSVKTELEQRVTQLEGRLPGSETPN